MKTLLLLFLFLSLQAYSQEISAEKMYGKWKVQKNWTPKSDPKLKDIIAGFNDAAFTFYDNGNFVLQSTNTSKLFMMTMNMLKNSQWKVDQKRQMILLGNQKDHFSIMGIVVKEREGKTFFLINETPIELEMIHN
jgi:hypothetical protein